VFERLLSYCCLRELVLVRNMGINASCAASVSEAVDRFKQSAVTVKSVTFRSTETLLVHPLLQQEHSVFRTPDLKLLCSRKSAKVGRFSVGKS
jgi:hypothetical protein